MNFTPFPVLFTERLVLRKLVKADCQEVLFLRSDKSVNQYIKRPTPKNLKDAATFVSRITKGIENNENIYWAISLKGSPQMIGSISLWHFSKDGKIGEVGYDLNPKYHQQGIMSEAMQVVLNYGFEQLNLDKIEAFTHHANESSKHLLNKNKFILIKDRIDKGNLDNIIFVLNKI